MERLDQIIAAVKWLLTDVLITFEFVTLVALVALLVAGMPHALRLFVEKVRTASILGLQVELTPSSSEDYEQAFSAALAKLKFDTNKFIAEKDPNGRWVKDIVSQFEEDLQELRSGLSIRGRCALHVRDPLFRHVLVQATPYYQFDMREVESKDTQGRRKSVRFGIIGKAWRTRASQSMTSEDHDPDRFVEQWGALQEEASQHRETPRWAVALVFQPRGAREPEAILYFDNTSGPVFLDENTTEADNADEFVARNFDDKRKFPFVKKIVSAYFDNIREIEVNISVYE